MTLSGKVKLKLGERQWDMIGAPAQPITEKLLASLLRKDRAAMEASLADALRFNDFPDELLFQAAESGLCGLFYERACELDAKESLKIPLPNGLNFFDYLENQAKQAAIKAVQFDERFFELLKFLDEELPHMIWIKSTVLARTLYSKLNYRVGIDYDVVVKQEHMPKLLKRLKQSGWQPLLGEPGHCHQIGVGPTENLADLFLVPQKELEGCHNLTMTAPGWPHLELKINPLDNGVSMKELDRFFADAVDVHWRESVFKAPSLVDHLIVELVHLHKHRLFGFGWIHDVHMICNKLNEDPSQWRTLTARLKKEGVNESARAALLRVKSLLHTEIPDEVIDELGNNVVLTAPLMKFVSTEFVWNANGLAMLVLNAMTMGDGKRKLRILSESIFPDDQFLSDYYCDGQKLNILSRLKSIVLHWLVLFLPAGVVRKMFGYAYWKHPDAEKFGVDG
ncbi:MAG: nucleotidyltransferase family protein [Candidatus Obscuribacterales bacterium]|nr:nucleotidyltransferase family protein [Candidatus Obscuribacterales bacterium]